MLQALANAEAINGDGMVAVRIDGDWHLFARAAVPPGHQQVRRQPLRERVPLSGRATQDVATICCCIAKQHLA